MANRRWAGPIALGAVMGIAAVVACTGDAGPAGPAGQNGATGPSGAGAAGQNGATGPAGATGATGPAGQNGTNGTNGTSGDAGANGNNGEAGATVILSTRAKHGLDISPVPVSLDGKTSDQIEQIGYGSYIVNAVADCNGCHTAAPNKFLAGGVPFPLGPAPDGGAQPQVTTRNLTPDTGTGLTLTEAQFIQALRTGADFQTAPSDGGAPAESLIVMPWNEFRWMSTSDLKAIYAYLRAIPAVSNAIPADVKPSIPPATYDPTMYTAGDQNRTLPSETDSQGNPASDPNNVLRGLAIVPFATTAPAAGAGLLTPPSSPSDLEYFARGSYIVNSQAICAACHSNPETTNTGAINTSTYLSGGETFATPTGLGPVFHTVLSMSANLVGPNGYFNGSTISLQQWVTEITLGVHADMPSPQPPLAWPMPWDELKNMELDDLTAVYTYVRAVAVASKGGALTIPDKATQDAARYCTNAATDCLSGELCDPTTNQCYGAVCTDGVDSSDCDACQTCTGAGTKHCALPAANGTCVAHGI